MSFSSPPLQGEDGLGEAAPKKLVERLYGIWAKQGARPNTVESRSIALSSLFSQATRHKKIATNPVTAAEKPSNPVIPIDERQLPSLDEITAIALSIGKRLEPAVWLMACGGLRIGESLRFSQRNDLRESG